LLRTNRRANGLIATPATASSAFTRESGSLSLYFHQNAYTAAGDKMVITTPDGISTVNLKTREIELVVADPRFGTNQSGIIVGKNSRQVFYTKRVDTNTTVAMATHLDTHVTREIGRIPGRGRGAMLAVNAEENVAGRKLRGSRAGK